MIRYDLVCAEGHAFESWFKDSNSCKSLLEGSNVLCPLCGSKDVKKQILAPALLRLHSREASPQSERPDTAVLSSPDQDNVRKAFLKLQKEIEKNAEYVGERFSEEARRIHYKECEQKAIYGEALAEDIKALTEEGIDILPLPFFKDYQ